MQTTKAELKYKMLEKAKSNMRMRDTGYNFYGKNSFKNPSLFRTIGSNRPMTQNFGHRSSMGNLHSNNLMASDMSSNQGFFHSRRKDNQRATSIQSSRSRKNFV